MSTHKESLDDQDPDYTCSVSSDGKHQELYEENARSTTARRISAIIEKEFSQEIDTKKNEILQIQERLHKALKTLHLLRYVVITDFYNRKQCQASQTKETGQVRIHPAIKQLIGKSLKRTHEDLTMPSTSTNTCYSTAHNLHECSSMIESKVTEYKDIPQNENSMELKKQPDAQFQIEAENLEDGNDRPRKIPRYVPPKCKLPEPVCPSRGMRHKVRRRIIVGNISKWIPPDWREDNASHKWTIYVRGSKEIANIGDFVSKVRFFLHPSYRPNDVVEISSVPFHLSRRGWGEFPLRVQLHFKNPINKPMDIIHHLKLDRTYTGLQTLGSETLVDVWIRTTKDCVSAEDDGKLDDDSILEATSAKNNYNKEELDQPVVTTSDQQSTANNLSKSVSIKEKSHELISCETYDSFTALQPTVTSEVPVNKLELRNGYCRSAPKAITKETSAEAFSNSSVIKNMNELQAIIDHDHNYTINHYTDRFNIPSNEKHVAVNLSDLSMTSNVDETSLNSMENTIYSVGNNLSAQCLQDNSHSAFPIDIKNGIEENRINENNTLKNSSPFLTIKERSNLSIPSHEDSCFKLTNREILHKDRTDTRNILIETNISNNSSIGISNPFVPNFQKSEMSLADSQSNLRPLKISIPPLFQPSTRNGILISQNNKYIPIDTSTKFISMVLSDKSAKARCKTGFLNSSSNINLGGIPSGTSVLKKHIVRSPTASTRGDNLPNNVNAILEIKPQHSLSLNVNCNVPALKIADVSLPKLTHFSDNLSAVSHSLTKDQLKHSNSTNQEDLTVKSRIILGKDKLKLNSEKAFYDETLRSIDLVKMMDTEALVRFIIRRLPIITSYASDPEYKRIHPYACSNEEAYFGHNPGKRGAYEWCRAKMVRSFLRKKSVSGEDLWSVKEIIIWARLHGYTPMRLSFNVETPMTMNGAKTLPRCSASSISTTCTESVKFKKWLQECQERSNQLSVNNNDSQNEVVDVLMVEEPASNKAKRLQKDVEIHDGSKSALSPQVISLESDERLAPLHNFICKTASQIGITFSSEEIVPNVLHYSASRIMLRATECMIEDLVRASLAKAWERNSDKGCPQTLTLDDVRNAISNREEFDIFTNEGLGSRHQSSSRLIEMD